MEGTSTAIRPRGIEELRQTARHLREDFGDLGAAARHTAEDSLADARRCAADFVQRGQTQARRTATSLEKCIREHPTAALLATAGAAALLGILWMRRN